MEMDNVNNNNNNSTVFSSTESAEKATTIIEGFVTSITGKQKDLRKLIPIIIDSLRAGSLSSHSVTVEKNFEIEKASSLDSESAPNSNFPAATNGSPLVTDNLSEDNSGNDPAADDSSNYTNSSTMTFTLKAKTITIVADKPSGSFKKIVPNESLFLGNIPNVEELDPYAEDSSCDEDSSDDHGPGNPHSPQTIKK
ncbi:MAG: hypothetical protein LBI56_01720 [Puniceicoccales bacterium]|jgi:hypothetical protein|nr:hypothetical protein [Puniceicoccales bacterium]